MLDLEHIRRRVVTAVCSDDTLFEMLVLKGGNALRLVYGLGARASLDLDFSMASDFPDVADAEARLARALADRFDSDGYVVFDLRFAPKPSVRRPGLPDTWGGYLLEFKLIGKDRYRELRGDIEDIRRQAEEVLGPNQKRVFRVEISKFEHCDGKVQTEIDGYAVYVYTPPMIAAEKLRALCQQMPDYELNRTTRRARARDFYDIHAIATSGTLRPDDPAWHDALRAIFRAKEVPLAWLGRIRDIREFHRVDWPQVTAAVSGDIESYDFYFDYVVKLVAALEPLWMEDPPA